MPVMTGDVIATLLKVSLGSDYSLSLSLNIAALALIGLLVGLALWGRWLWLNRQRNIEFDSAELGIGSQRISFKPNRRDQEIAYKIWVELSTRKIGLPIDLEHDVIVEIYDSWHTFFSITRELIKDVPVSKLKSESTRKIITLSVNLLNDGLRPHLTTWQARFRRWYELQLSKAPDDADPQSIQQKFKSFDALRADLQEVNARLIIYREKMRELVLGLPTDSKSESVDKGPTL